MADLTDEDRDLLVAVLRWVQNLPRPTREDAAERCGFYGCGGPVRVRAFEDRLWEIQRKLED